MPNSRPDRRFAERLEFVVKRLGNATRLAAETGISRRSIGDYLAGLAEPSRPRLVAIAQAAGVSVGWLATGDGPVEEASQKHNASERPGTTTDTELLGRVWEGVSTVHAELDQHIPPIQQASIVGHLYDHIVIIEDARERKGALRFALDILRDDLRRRANAAEPSNPSA
ncbi:MAG: helix-turn-helix domain-containing protein [Azospirillaceae bacterium]|nr:helix-turn-helix domain-containing protein [Azospirillaceae bacterium]